MEILSPAGSFDCLRAAVQNGADAVYLGGAEFSARKAAENFDDAELEKAIDYAHVRNCKVYVALNTLIKERELKRAVSFIEKVRRMGADALIVQDTAILSIMHNYFDDFPLHVSTQATIASTCGVNFLKEKYNAARVVLARELSFDEIADIKKKTDVEIEVFVHGALCMSYSGQCLFSSMLGSRSGNRGACAQPCRLSYTLYEGKKAVTKILPLLSPKDLCLADEIQKLSEIGVDSLKIEGRLKSPEYVAATTRVYSEAAKNRVDMQEIDKMLKLFSRGGASKGYFYGRTFAKMMSYEGGTKISADKKIKSEMKRSFDGENKKSKINLFFEGYENTQMKLTATNDSGACVSVYGPLCVRAQQKATSDERIKEQLKKLGNTPFEEENIEVYSDGLCAISVKDINELRRNAIEKLSDVLSSSYKREERKIDFNIKKQIKPQKDIELNVSVTTKEQYEAVKDIKGINIFAPYSIFEGKLPQNVICMLPPILKDRDVINTDDFNKVEINNIGQLALVNNKEVYGGSMLNICNSYAAQTLKEIGIKTVSLSPELTLGEIKELIVNTDADTELTVYGRHRLMCLENCVIKSAYGCKCKEKNFSLKDRKGVFLPIITENCRNVILNSRPLYMADKMYDIKNLQISAVRLIFTVENPEMCCIIIEEYKKALRGLSAEYMPKEYTRGHFYRGTE